MSVALNGAAGLRAYLRVVQRQVLTPDERTALEGVGGVVHVPGRRQRADESGDVGSTSGQGGDGGSTALSAAGPKVEEKGRSSAAQHRGLRFSSTREHCQNLWIVGGSHSSKPLIEGYEVFVGESPV